ncbi:MAG TPA: hypothetical protein VF292_05990 [Rhodanobacteraceae bacterium]
MNEERPESPPPEPRKRVGWLRREGIDLGDAIVQFFSVLLGVLFALLINQWNDHRQQQAKAQAVMRQQQATVGEATQAIHVELAGNRQALHASVTKLYATSKALGPIAKNRKAKPLPCYGYPAMQGSNGVFVVLTNAAYQAAIATQAMSHMRFRTAHQIAEVYGAQQLFQTGSSIIRKNLLKTSPQNAKQCIGWLESLGLSERSLNGAYSAIIGADKTRWPAPPFPFLKATNPQ